MTNISMRVLATSAIAVAVVLSSTTSAQAASLGGFGCITNNSPAHCAIGEAQLSADLTGDLLTIQMTGTNPAVVEQVFIEGAGVTGGIFVMGGPVGADVIFNDATAGGNLPGGNTVNFMEAINFAATKPPPNDGIGYHDQDPISGQFAVFQLFGDLSNLRVGVHVIGFDQDGSESFVTPGRAVPEPSAALAFAVGSLVIGTATRRSER